MPSQSPYQKGLRCPVCSKGGFANIGDHIFKEHRPAILEAARRRDVKIAAAKKAHPLPSFRHATKTPHQCPECEAPRFFATPKTLARHVRETHTRPATRYLCPVCYECNGPTPAFVYRQMKRRGCIAQRECPLCSLTVRRGPIGRSRHEGLDQLAAHVADVHYEEHSFKQADGCPNLLQMRPPGA